MRNVSDLFNIFSRSLAVLLCIVAALGCTRKPNSSSTLRFRMPEEQAPMSSKSSGVNANELISMAVEVAPSSGWYYPAPESMSMIKCYAVAVETPEASTPATCTDIAGTKVLSPNFLVGPLPSGATISLDVPSGASRNVYLIGFAAAGVEDCPVGTVVPNRGKLSAPRILGHKTVELTPGTTEITISANLTGATVFETCSTWPAATPPPPTLPSVSADTAAKSVAEGATGVKFDVQLSAPSASNISIPYSVSGSASATDHSLTSGVISIAAGDVVGSVTYNIVNDALVEGTEDIVITLGNPTGATLGAIPSQTVAIMDDDVPAISPAYSLVSLSSGTINAGSMILVTLQAKDISNVPMSVGGATVVFSTTGGVSAGSFSAVVDNNDGTYSANFTGLTAGAATSISATINGVPVTSTLPSLTVLPGSPSTTLSLVTSASGSIASGSATMVTLTAVDAYGNNLTTGGETVVFSHSGGGSAGTFSAVIDNADGTYVSTFTGTAAGSATGISATIGGAAVTTSPALVVVSPGPASPATSLVTLGTSSIQYGYSTLATLTTKDAYGNLVSTGGRTVSFSKVGGSSDGNFSAVTDVGNGTYTATFTGTVIGGASPISASIDSVSVTTALPTITVTSINLNVAPIYPASGGNWNDYVKFDNTPMGTSPFDQDDTACSGAETGYHGALNGCVHGGELRKVVVGNQTSCVNLTATDSLGAFAWSCDASSGTAIFYSILMPGKGLRDLVDSGPGWIPNSVTVQKSAVTIGTSPSIAWWGNPIMPLSANAGALTSLNTAGAIYVATSNLTTMGLVITVPRVSVVTLPAVVLQSTGSTATNFAASACYSGSAATAQMICAGNQNFLWLEATINGTNGPNPLLTGMRIYNSKFSRIHGSKVYNLKTTTNTMAAYEIDVNSTSNLITASKADGVGMQGGMRISGSTNSIRNFDVSRNTDVSSANQSLMVIASGANNNRLHDVRLSYLQTTGATSYGLKIMSNGNIVTGLTISNIGTSDTNSGLMLSGASSNIISRATIFSVRDAGIEFNGATAMSNNILTHISTINNYWNGFYMTGNVSNTYVQDFVSVNTDRGIQSPAGGSGSGNLFTNIVSANNGSAIAVDLQGGQGSSFAGFLNIGDLVPVCSGGGLSALCGVPLLSNFSSSFVGKVTTNDLINGSDSSGSATFATNLDWLGFDSFFRGWGKDYASGFPNAQHLGPCTTGACRIWDLRASTGGPLHYKGADGSSTNTTFVGGSVCPSEVHGSNVASAAGKTFLKYAIEIDDDAVGNNNGLCETGEACLYAPNIGSYQGEGNYKAAPPCTFQNGAVSGVQMYSFPVSGI